MLVNLVSSVCHSLQNNDFHQDSSHDSLSCNISYNNIQLAHPFYVHCVNFVLKEIQ